MGKVYIKCSPNNCSHNDYRFWNLIGGQISEEARRFTEDMAAFAAFKHDNAARRFRWIEKNNTRPNSKCITYYKKVLKDILSVYNSDICILNN